jgi:hypothetical protein
MVLMMVYGVLASKKIPCPGRLFMNLSNKSLFLHDRMNESSLWPALCKPDDVPTLVDPVQRDPPLP